MRGRHLIQLEAISPRPHRAVAAIAVALTAGLLAAPQVPAAAQTPHPPEQVLFEGPFGYFQPIRTNGYLAWQRNSRERPNRFDVFVQPDGAERPRKVNGPRVNAANGDIDGDLLVYQAFAGRRSNLRFFDLAANTHTRTPPRVNTRRWEYWPSMSDGKLLFGRLLPNGARRLILYDLVEESREVLARTRGKRAFLQPGQVNGNWAVWSRCPAGGRCNVIRYDIAGDQRRRVPNPRRFQRSPSVTQGGTVYFTRTGRQCGNITRLMRFSPGRGVTPLTRLPRGADISSTYAFDHPDGNKEVYFEHNVCARPAASEVWKVLDPRLFELTVTTEGAGTVTSSPPGINCGSDCSEEFEGGTEVTLTATPAAGSEFAGWGGACAGVLGNSCKVTTDEDQAVTATFSGVSHTLTVSKAGTGTGTVTSNPAGINCGATCSASYPHGSAVQLTAAPAAGSAFTGWSGACSGTSPTCTVTMDQARSATANFVPAHILSVSKTGNGTVTSNPAGINCGTSCSASYPVGTVVQLTATAASGETFSGWGGDCAAAGTSTTCTVTMNQARNVSATFSGISFTLTVTRSGSGDGTVTSNPAGINCPGTCSADYGFGQQVTLTATPDDDSEFANWTGDCNQTVGNTCTVTMNSNKNVTATFTPKPNLTVATLGDGDGTVTSDDGGINCGAPGTTGDCSERYATGTPVELTAAAPAGSTFTGWGGDCASAGSNTTCNLTMTMNRNVTATFEADRTLTVTIDGDGDGRVTSDVGGIDCSSPPPGTGECDEIYAHGTEVTLTAEVTGIGHTFVGWGGDGSCSDTATTCSVTMNQARDVTAEFDDPLVNNSMATSLGPSPVRLWFGGGGGAPVGGRWGYQSTNWSALRLMSLPYR